MTATKAPSGDEHDSAWKAALHSYLSSFFEFFFPEFYSQIDWSRRPRFHDRELAALAPKSRGRKGAGKRLVDLLAELRRVDSTPLLVLVHIEVQASRTEDFAKRLFFYHARILESYQKPLTTIAVLADRQPSWRPNSYTSEFWRTSIRFDFPMIKLQDYKDRIRKLESSTNPFALLVVATLYAQTASPDSPQRLERKFDLVKKMYESGMSRTQIVDFFRLVDHVMSLSPSLEREFHLKLEKYEEESVMPINLLSSIERRAMEKGLEKGLEKGRKEASLKAIRVVLEVRFACLPSNFLKQLSSMDADKLESLLPQAATIDSLDDFIF